jgi:hypothetical protein
MEALPLDLSETPEALQPLVAGCAQYVHAATGVMLDLTPETLPVLDHYLSEARAAGDDLKELVARLAGAYFGELVRSLYPARWRLTDHAEGWRLEFERCFLYFNPAAFAREAIEGADVVEGGAGFGVSAGELDVLQAALAVFGEVSAEDYYRLSTRLEALGPLVDRLTANALQRGEAEGGFGPELYARALDVSVFDA